MNCPFCKKKLNLEGNKAYETLDEHVSCVEPIEKPFYKCTCDISKDIFWGIDGSRYGGKFSNKYFKYILKNSYHSHWKTDLIGSWTRNYHRNQYFLELFRLKNIIDKFNTFKFKVSLIFNKEKRDRYNSI